MTSAALKSNAGMEAGQQRPSAWQRHMAALGVVWGVILLLFWRDVWTMVSTWWNISTYNHCLLIPPILYWLVHQRREELAKLTPRIWAPGLAWIGLASFGWLLGEAAGVAFARQLAIVMMLQGAVVTILGRSVAQGLLFPLCFSFFLVPFGEEFVPFLQTVTADLSMIFLGWAGIPAYIDGIFISTPTGYFEVAEACSGIKFLVAMIAYGALVANVCFKSWSRRILFMLAAMLVPILANGIRAFGTIYIAHHTSTDFATGFDHILYGWFFFAFVLALVMALGWPFFDRKIDEPMINTETIVERRQQSKLGLMAVLPLTGAIIAAPLLWTSVLAARTSDVPDQIALPQISGWEKVSYKPQYDWKPRFDGANHQLLGRYQSAETGQLVDLAIAVYDRQEDGREIVGYGQGGFDPSTKWSWTRDLEAPSGASGIQITAPGPVVRDVYSFYRISDVLTGSAAAVKLETMKVKLLGGDQQAVAVLVSMEKRDDTDPSVTLDGFLTDLGPIDKLADRMAGLR